MDSILWKGLRWKDFLEFIAYLYKSPESSIINITSENNTKLILPNNSSVYVKNELINWVYSVASNNININ